MAEDVVAMTGEPADFRGLFLGFVIAGVGFLAWCMWLFQRAREPYLASDRRAHLELAGTNVSRAARPSSCITSIPSTGEVTAASDSDLRRQ
ncbi:MAG TPA: hypothetical protein VF118_03830 [Gemmatimonadaceae bacterium]